MSIFRSYTLYLTVLISVFLLASCASGPTENEVVAESSRVAVAEAVSQAQAKQAENEVIEVTGSRHSSSEKPKEIGNSLVQVAPADVATLLQQLTNVIALNEESAANSDESRELAHIQMQFARGVNLNTAEKEALYRLVSRYPEISGQVFKRYRVNPTIQTIDKPVSTFAMDVDNGSFKLAKNMLEKYQMPNPDGIRVEEFVNAIDYRYAQNSELFALSAEAAPSPFREGYHILHIGAQARSIDTAARNPSNLVLLADVSGSMGDENKLGLLKTAMKTLVSQLNQNDRIAIVAYSDNAKVVLSQTKASKKRLIYKAIDRLKSSGSTNVEAGLVKGYDLAEKMLQPGFNNRVILSSDGIANSGALSPELILARVGDAKRKGIFLTTLGVGTSVYNDHLLEQLANQGNGTYLYVANENDIQEAFVDNLSAQLQIVAKNAKIQVSFNPERVSHYRLLGYENRLLQTDDFLDAEKDGAEVGAGQRVTAIYEIKLKPSTQDKKSPQVATPAEANNQIANVAIAYQKPMGVKVHIINKVVPESVVKSAIENASPDSILSFAVSAFAEKLRRSYWARFYDYGAIETLMTLMPRAYKKQTQVQEFITLLDIANDIDDQNDGFEERHPISQMSFERVPLLD